jgi:hypothetical protein
MHAIAIPARNSMADFLGWLVHMATVFTTVGKAWVVDKIDEVVGAGTKQKYVGWGTGAGTAVVGDTTLFTEDTGGSPAYARVICTITQPAADTYRNVGTITSNGTKTVTNAGLFDAATVGVMMIKGDHAGVPLLLNDSIEYTLDLQVT